MVDTLCSGSGEIPLKINLDGEIKISESAVTLLSTEDGSNSKHNATVHFPRSSVPRIVIMDNASSSFSGPLNVKDISNCKSKRRDKKNRRKDQDMEASVPIEGQRAEVAIPEETAISSEPRLTECGWIDSCLATASSAFDKRTAMERADISPYTSDEWEVESNTTDDHTDSSDDDDPKSQVDRLIERGTLIYMEGENSALSSEDDSDDEEYDSESDITDVSPLVSAAASPLGLSPVLPRRHLATSPLALHHRSLSHQFDFIPPNNSHEDPLSQRFDQTPPLTMDPLLRAVMELEENRNRAKFNLNPKHCKPPNTGLPKQTSDQVFIHPIRDNPHHHHLNKTYSRRKNMSFSNEQVRTIDRDNKILLNKIMAVHRAKRTVSSPHIGVPDHANHRPSNSSVNRRKGEERIRRENLVSFPHPPLFSPLLLKKIHDAKPSKEVTEGRVPQLGTIEPLLSSVGVSNHSLRSPTNSCGAFMRSISQSPHGAVPPPRKETAL